MFTKVVNCLNTRGLKSFLTTMARVQNQFKGQLDRYNGLTVDSQQEPCEATLFPNRLEASLDQWITEKRRAIWFKVDLSQSHWIPELVKRGFKFHHAKQEQAMLYRWLPTVETCNLPPYAHTNLGVGAVVLNDETKEILVVKENHSIATNFWKLPGGYVEPAEDISTAAEREVLEETGIIAKFKCLLAFRHSHSSAFGCSDIYIVSCLTPKTYEITKCDREISECKWMKLEEFASHHRVHENNRLLANKVLEYINNRIGMTCTRHVHPITKKPLCLFSFSDKSDV